MAIHTAKRCSKMLRHALTPLCAVAVGHETLAKAFANVAVKCGLVVGVLRRRFCVSHIVYNSCSANAKTCMNRQLGRTHRIANSEGSCRKCSSCDGGKQLACGAGMPAHD